MFTDILFDIIFLFLTIIVMSLKNIWDGLMTSLKDFFNLGMVNMLLASISTIIGTILLTLLVQFIFGLLSGFIYLAIPFICGIIIFGTVVEYFKK